MIFEHFVIDTINHIILLYSTQGQRCGCLVLDYISCALPFFALNAQLYLRMIWRELCKLRQVEDACYFIYRVLKKKSLKKIVWNSLLHVYSFSAEGMKGSVTKMSLLFAVAYSLSHI